MSSKLKFFLLDAGPIIEPHRLDLWHAALDRTDIFVPRVVAETEAEYWVREDDSRHPINALADGEAGRLTIVDCDQADLRETFDLFDHAVQQSVDPGELHALTLLRLWDDQPMPAFCSADKMAMVCLCLLGFSEAAVSLEDLLAGIGFTVHLERRFTRQEMERWVADGRRRKAQGLGLA
jgi:hypothetical protein